MIPIIVNTVAAYNINSNLLSIEVTINMLMHIMINIIMNIILYLTLLKRPYHIHLYCPGCHSDYQ